MAHFMAREENVHDEPEASIVLESKEVLKKKPQNTTTTRRNEGIPDGQS